MEFEDDAFVLSARPHGEAGAIVEFLTATHGRYAAHVAGGTSRRIKPFLQPGARAVIAYRARVSDQLGSASLEPVGEGPSALFDDALALAGLSAAAAVAAAALPEREPHPGAFYAFEALTDSLIHPDIWPAIFVRFEAGLLQDLGFGLDLSKCAATGVLDNLIYVSPRTGRAVSAEAGEPYKDKLLHLPPFLLSAQGGIAPGDIRAGLDLTAHFLQAFVFNPLNRPLPQARLWLVDRLSDADRL
ncbi:MAG: DNA repair protein RecO [Phenylobacterium sp.]|jgi:DNA repair protein RecO (recombination protein O)|uniref:DNA repair protein RecO n=1 Tax=Phenylobacterium ferrooxidans TaxID=2982689 RepID=A0ABW6CJD2_9CAUL|nr:DNA repair protein RecO [Phenylobacterium sp.]MDO8322451.1 DNA repair protein RecO [Phenylobacterium sp.]MDO8910296.1 DNA repair protein RecO [Phenylobacterium sp.]MDO9246537.1 DNA repair protein RecO [Phenylobacterium sp.]MDP3102827.1 DNA repair protein RecO [Phenylobacterium sp.]HQT55179.1 DNA repair protein RecO [Phenylobacterium sp.]